jgi:hypothetical protein
MSAPKARLQGHVVPTSAIPNELRFKQDLAGWPTPAKALTTAVVLTTGACPERGRATSVTMMRRLSAAVQG